MWLWPVVGLLLLDPLVALVSVGLMALEVLDCLLPGLGDFIIKFSISSVDRLEPRDGRWTEEEEEG